MTADLPALHPDHVVDRRLLEMAIDWIAATRAPRADPVPPVIDLALPERLPENGLGTESALNALVPSALEGAAQLHHPGYFAHMDPPTPAIVWAAALWQTAANQNLLHPDAAPAARRLSERVVGWLLPAFGMGGGHFVAGSSAANLTALWAARELRGIKRVVASGRAHLSVRKAADILRLRYETAATSARHRIEPSRLEDLSDAALVLTAGTVATGAIDPLDAAGRAAWTHVDAAWAGPLRLTDRHRDLLDGVDRADSVAFSAHKWLYQAKGAAIVLFKDAVGAHDAVSYGGGYLAEPNIGLAGTAPAVALPLAATLLAWGRSGLAQRIEDDMARAERLAGRVHGDGRFELWGPSQSGIVVWRPRDANPVAVRDRLRNAWVSLTEIDGEPWFRSVAANPSADPDWVFARVVAAMTHS